MPADYGFRLDDVEGIPPVRPEAAQDVPERSISPSEAWSDRIALKDFDLMTEGQILCDERLGDLSSEIRAWKASLIMIRAYRHNALSP